MHSFLLVNIGVFVFGITYNFHPPCLQPFFVTLVVYAKDGAASETKVKITSNKTINFLTYLSPPHVWT